MNKIIFYDTHVFPGCLAEISFKLDKNNVINTAIIEFSDGVISNAEVEYKGPEELLLNIYPYTTARGSAIAKKSWYMRLITDQNIWKVVSKL